MGIKMVEELEVTDCVPSRISDQPAHTCCLQKHQWIFFGSDCTDARLISAFVGQTYSLVMTYLVLTVWFGHAQHICQKTFCHDKAHLDWKLSNTMLFSAPLDCSFAISLHHFIME